MNTEQAKTYSRGKLITLSHCPACQAEHQLSNLLYTRQDDEKLMSDTWHIYECSHCYSSYINPRPAESSLNQLYSDYLTHRPVESESVENSQTLFWSLVRGYLHQRFKLNFPTMRQLPIGALLFTLLPPFRQKLDRYGRNLPKVQDGARLLDVGCGAGHFLELAQKMNWQAQGCDFDPTIVNICKARGLDVRLGGLDAFEDSKGKFDALTMNQVLEHVADPKGLIHSCHSYLRDHGVIWIALPNPAAIGKKLFKEGWAGLHPPYHLCLPDQAIIVQWLKAAGFDSIQIVKCGPHSKHNWRESQNIINRQGLGGINKFKVKYNYIVSNITSCFSPRKSEETVILAVKNQTAGDFSLTNAEC